MNIFTPGTPFRKGLGRAGGSFVEGLSMVIVFVMDLWRRE
jgi:hypothetical protein